MTTTTFSSLKGIPEKWTKLLRNCGITVVNVSGMDSECWGATYYPDLKVIAFYEEPTVTAIAHELVHVMQERVGRLLPEVIFPEELYDQLRNIGYDEAYLEREAEAYLLERTPEVIYEMCLSVLTNE